MIVFIEGPRNCGKTFLINQFMEGCTNPNIQYYKFYFANHVKLLGLQELDVTPALHYFSLGNIMTIMEMNLLPENKDKVWIFDRAIISAYTWAVLRHRLTKKEATEEYLKLLKSPLFQNCKTVVIKVNKDTEDSQRTKDIWDGAHSTQDEFDLMQEFIRAGFEELTDEIWDNDIEVINNQFDAESVKRFNSGLRRVLGINNPLIGPK